MQSSGLASGDVVNGEEPELAVRKMSWSPMHLTFRR